MRIDLEGRARRLGDDINTDYIITSTRKKETLDESALKRYLLETVDPAFAASVLPGDLLVAGRNFGSGSAMEIAATVILAAGIRAVVATTFARTFYRNAINNGLIPVECDTSGIDEGDRLSIRLSKDAVTVTRQPARSERGTSGLELHGVPLPPIMLQVLSAGGLVNFVRNSGRSLRIG
jgi:3-isopropylmalate/(R)-2-methylmalate dehydratase small subunit